MTAAFMNLWFLDSMLNSKEVSLTPKTVETLFSQVEWYGAIVSKDEMTGLVWENG